MAKRASSKTTTAKKEIPGTAPVAPVAPAAPAATSKPAPAGSKPAAKPAVTREMITKRAYEIWERKGRPIGKDLENWQEAERDLGVR